MDNQKLTAEWQERIVECCEKKLGRQLFPAELQTIERFRGFQALEMIEDMVSHAHPSEIERYLRSIVAR